MGVATADDVTSGRELHLKEGKGTTAKDAGILNAIVVGNRDPVMHRRFRPRARWRCRIQGFKDEADYAPRI